MPFTTYWLTGGVDWANLEVPPVGRNPTVSEPAFPSGNWLSGRGGSCEMDICPCVGATGKRTKEHVLRVPWLEGAPHESDVCAEAFPVSAAQGPVHVGGGAGAHSV